MNKMKFEKLILNIGLGVFFVGFVVHFVLAIKYNDVEHIVDGLPFIVYMSFIFVVMAKNAEIKKYMIGGAGIVMVMSKMAHDLSRYEKMYGKLPEEEKKEEGTNEEKKAE